MTAPPRPCPRCRQLVASGTRCRRCAHVRDRERGSAEVRGYGADWSAYSRAWLRRFPYCGLRADGQFHVEHSQCAAQGVRVRATVTDHIVPIRAGGARLDPTNHQSLCARCNVTKDAARGARLG
jgi:5-methylcytosine-specific restriction endonuclease McrA